MENLTQVGAILMGRTIFEISTFITTKKHVGSLTSIADEVAKLGAPLTPKK